MSPATLDLCVLGLLLLFAVAGAFSGALRQLVQLAAVVAGWAAARFLAPRLGGPVLGSHPTAVGRMVLCAGCFVVAVVLVGLAGRALAKALHGPSGRPGALDRALGALLGGAKALLAAWVIVSVLVKVGPIDLGGFHLDARRSDFGALVARHDLLEAAVPDQARRLERLLEKARDPAQRARLLESDPGARRLLEDPRFKALLERHGEGRAEALQAPELKALLEKLELGE